MEAQNPVNVAQVGRFGALFSGSILFVFQQGRKRMRLSDGSSLDSPASLPSNIPVGWTWTLAAPREATEDDAVSSPPSFSEEEAVQRVEGGDDQDFLLSQVIH